MGKVAAPKSTVNDPAFHELLHGTQLSRMITYKGKEVLLAGFADLEVGIDVQVQSKGEGREEI